MSLSSWFLSEPLVSRSHVTRRRLQEEEPPGARCCSRQFVTMKTGSDPSDPSKQLQNRAHGEAAAHDSSHTSHLTSIQLFFTCPIAAVTTPATTSSLRLNLRLQLASITGVRLNSRYCCCNRASYTRSKSISPGRSWNESRDNSSSKQRMVEKQRPGEFWRMQPDADGGGAAPVSSSPERSLLSSPTGCQSKAPGRVWRLFAWMFFPLMRFVIPQVAPPLAVWSEEASVTAAFSDAVTCAVYLDSYHT
ncbi:unnamed protein product [Pleuronectes platessa]|uniref:Uncharacterized protein n=1 Tax=Pleuronectes platessa TaxID=8262 RepID=A0A9N7VLN2_PLEPL|nr:unnamed protein product [Pleuronectes platessa]